jgi:NAD(P)H dehydrogenase (quinone)
LSINLPLLVTGAAGRVGGVGGAIVQILRQRNLPVRALVRREDEHAEALRATGAEVVIGDLTRAEDVARALAGCRRVYFGMSVSAAYLEATATAAAVARERGDLEVFVNISQMTVPQMSLTDMTDSPHQRQHWLAEQVLNWSGLPVVHLRATVSLAAYTRFISVVGVNNKSEPRRLTFKMWRRSLRPSWPVQPLTSARSTS